MASIHNTVKDAVGKAYAFGKRLLTSEGFQSEDDDAPVIGSIVAGIYSFIFGGMLIFFLIGFGAARLSFCYNQSIGTSIELTYIYAAIAFIFCYAYYPFYSFFLNPLCVKRTNMMSVRR